MRKPKVGETLYMLNINNAAHHKAQVLVPVQVSRVGNKYFSVGDGIYRVKEFTISNWREKTNGSADYRLFEKDQEWFDERDHNALTKSIREAFSHYGKSTLSLDQLRRIQSVIMECK